MVPQLNQNIDVADVVVVVVVVILETDPVVSFEVPELLVGGSGLVTGLPLGSYL